MFVPAAPMVTMLTTMTVLTALAVLSAGPLPGAEPPSEAAAASAESAPSRAKDQPAKDQAAGGRMLFNGKDLKDWKVTEFGGEGDVEVKEGALTLGFGADLTGVSYLGKLPRNRYEITLEAQRVDGNDFFCGMTFPVGESYCSLIIGGWGGGVCGLSSIDGYDASENETTSYREFKKGRWYRIRLRVTEKRIDAWIDDDQIVKQEIEGRKLSLRPEVEASKPFGLASWQTTAALRKIRLRELTEAEVKKIGREKESRRERESD